MTSVNYFVCIHEWEGIYGRSSQLFSENERLFKVRLDNQIKNGLLLSLLLKK